MEVVLLFVCLVLATILIGHLLHLKRVHWLTEGSVALLVGLLAGGGVFAYFVHWHQALIPKKLVAFHTEVFFDVLLPPIIFQAGFSVKKKLFFQNFMTLVLFGVVGTFLTTAAIAAGSYFTLSQLQMSGAGIIGTSLALGAIFSSSDSVATLQMLDQDATPLLYSLVFGEGVVNDATSIVLLRAIQRMHSAAQFSAGALGDVLSNFALLFLFSLLLGVGVGLLSSLIIKHAFVKHSTDREVCVVALMGFLAFLLAEYLQLSGIFAVFFCGIAMSHYTWHGLSPSAKVVTVYLFRMLSFLSELFLFIYAGFGMWSTSLWQHSIYTKGEILGKAGVLAASLLGQVFLARGGVLLLLVALANAWRPRAQRIDLPNATVIWWAGSARGAITVALAYHSFAQGSLRLDLENQMIIVASMAVVAFSTVVLGALTGPLLDYLLRDEEGMATLPSAHSFCPGDGTDGSLSQPLLTRGGTLLTRLGHWNRCSYIHTAWHKLDGKFLQPLFGGRQTKPEWFTSPPSPGRQTMYQIIGPHVVQQHLGDGTPGTSGDVSAQVAVGAEAPLDGTLLPAGRPAAGERRLERREMMEGYCTRDSSRLSDVAEEELEWQDQDKFGDDAYLAAGAPDAPRSSTEGQSSRRSEEHTASGGTSRAALSRHASRDPDTVHQLLPLWPSPFDHSRAVAPGEPRRQDRQHEAGGQQAAGGVQQERAAQAGGSP